MCRCRCIGLSEDGEDKMQTFGIVIRVGELIFRFTFIFCYLHNGACIISGCFSKYLFLAGLAIHRISGKILNLISEYHCLENSEKR